MLLKSLLVGFAVIAATPSFGADYVLCFGEHDYECKKRFGEFDEHIGCGHAMVGALAKATCKAKGYTTKEHSNQGGNKCGYMLIDINCN